MEQLVEVVSNLSVAEKEQIMEVIDVDTILLSDEQKQIILQRQKDFKEGRMESYSVDQVKSMLGYTE